MVALQPVTAEMIATMQRCKIVSRLGTGYDAIDFEAAAAAGIWVTNVPDYGVDEVSTHALALLLALERNLKEHFNLIDGGDWQYLQAKHPIRRLKGQTLGVLGYGRIGSEMGSKSKGVGFQVIAHDPWLSDDQIRERGAEPVDFASLLRESDAISLHIPLSPETRHIINADALKQMKPTAFLINTARGEIVDIDALVDAVRNGVIAGAGIDVLPVEPPPPDLPILHEPRIIVTPHIAWASNEATVDMRRRGAEDVVRVLRGERPRTPINEVVSVVGR
jgi:D-3-phosphoglycerate dehydrogenase